MHSKIILITVVGFLIPSLLAVQCGGKWKGYTFDVTPLRRNYSDEEAKEWQYELKEFGPNVRQKNEVIYINPCGYANISYCGKKREMEDSPIYQQDFSTRETSCNMLGKLETGYWSLMKKWKPEFGVQVSYGDGDACISGYRRNTTLRFMCDKSKDPGEIMSVKEIMPCKYEIDIQTIHGCPISYDDTEDVMKRSKYVVSSGSDDEDD